MVKLLTRCSFFATTADSHRVRELFKWASIITVALLPVHAASLRANELSVELPNIILAMADDQGWGDVGYYGKSPAKTPSLDAMAASSLRLDRFYAACPVCSPTRGSVLTGRHPNRFGCFEWGHSLRPQEVTIAEALKQAGYVTGHFGKWHLGSVTATSDVSPGGSGFDTWFSSPNFFDLDPLMSRNGKVVRTKGEGSDVTVDAALSFIRDCANRKQKFLAVVWFGSPHNPHHAVEKDRSHYPGLSKEMQEYYGEITAIDRNIGRMRDALRELNIAENTLFWYTSDNGPQGPSNRSRPGSTGGFRDRKGTVYEGGLRVPTIIEWPMRIRQPRISAFPGNTVDIYPTLAELVGVDVPNQPKPLDGISLVPLLKANIELRQKPMGFWSGFSRGLSTRSRQLLEAMEKAEQTGDAPAELNPPATRKARIDGALKMFKTTGLVGNAAWTLDRYKLIKKHPRMSDKVTFELYDLIDDPSESRNLATAQPQRVKSMAQSLEQWQQSVIQSLQGRDYLTPATSNQ